MKLTERLPVEVFRGRPSKGELVWAMAGGEKSTMSDNPKMQISLRTPEPKACVQDQTSSLRHPLEARELLLDDERLIKYARVSALQGSPPIPWGARMFGRGECALTA
jgi:hypothetical protein